MAAALEFLTTSDLHRINPGRSISSIRRDYRYFRDVFGIKKGAPPGIPLHLYADYMNVPAEMIQRTLGRSK